MNTAATDASVDADAVLRTLANERRRVVLRSLDAAPGNERSVAELVEDVVDGVGPEGTPDQAVHRHVFTELSHSHLPALEEVGLVVHDRDDDVVRNDADESTRELVESIEQYEPTQ